MRSNLTLTALAAFTLSACGSGSGSSAPLGADGGGSGGSMPGVGQTAACARYIDCVASTTPQALGSALESYGPEGSCWSQGAQVSATCNTACLNGLVQTHQANPQASACVECVSDADCLDATRPSCSPVTRACSAPGKVPPKDPGGPKLSGPTVVLAVDRLFWGDTDWSGNKDSGAWSLYGYDLDGIASDAASSAHCQLASGATPNVKADGPGGTDNSYGRQVIPLLEAFSPSISADSTDSIQAGELTYLLRLDGLSAATQSPLPAALYLGGPLPAPPQFDGSDVWPVAFESVVNGDVQQPVNFAPSAYVNGGTFVWAPKSTLMLRGTLLGYDVDLSVRQAVVTVKLDGTGIGAKGTQGIIAGVLDAEELIASLKFAAGSLDPSLCDGATLEVLASQLRRASDIMLDGSNGDASQTCNGISFGIGFEAKPVNLGGVAAPVPPSGDPCSF